MGGESEAAWRALLDDLVNRSLKTPELVIVDGAPDLEKALCRALERRAGSERLHEELSNDYKDMIYAGTRQEIETTRKAFIRKCG
jgi:hypothetical protein